MEETWLDTTIREDDSTTTRESSTTFKEIKMSYAALEIKILQWAEQRQIIPNSTALAQAIKTTEEVAELLKALSKGDIEEAKDAYADILVTVIIGAALLDVDLMTCLNNGYETIKDRRGYLTKDGIFVKQG
jgi:NTP pyrophosphatase (non-canonical NTP hydrolase)